MKKFLFFILIWEFPLFAFDAKSLVGEKIYEKLKKEESIQINRYDQKDVKLELLPSSELCAMVSNLWSKDLGIPVLVGENLYLIPKIKLSKDISCVNIESAFKIMRAISKMQGMEYISHGKKKVLYKQANCIKGPFDRTGIPDDMTSDAQNLVQYCLLNDNSLGKTNYKVSYFMREEEAAVDFVNITGVFAGPFKAIDENNLHINLVILDCGEDIMIYMLVKAKYPKISMLENKLNDSFSSRLNAIYSWFVKQF